MPYPTGPIITSGPILTSGDSTATATTLTTPVDSSAAAMTVAAPETVKPVVSGADLVLEDIRLASPATLVAGPAYTVKFRNQGTADAANFQVGLLVGLDGKLTDDAPRAIVEVKSLAAGEVKEVTLRLPQNALMLAGPDGRPTAFTHLFVAVDLMNTVAETDETNNTAIVERTALEPTAK
jgi:subtilase family serine protease